MSNSKRDCFEFDFNDENEHAFDDDDPDDEVEELVEFEEVNIFL